MQWARPEADPGAFPPSPAAAPPRSLEFSSISLPPAKSAPAVGLKPAATVCYDGGGWLAATDEPWLALDLDLLPIRGLWLELTYAASFFDRLSRPLLRFETDEGDIDYLLCGPIFGRARWIGRVPKTARRVRISPSMRPGRFGFEIESARVLGFTQVAASTMRADMRQSLVWFGARTIGLRKASGTALRQALTTTAFSDYDSWRRQNLRAPDPAGLERPRSDWAKGPEVRLAALWRPDEHAFIESMLEYLRQQSWPRWSLAVIADPAARLSKPVLSAIAEGRAIRVGADARIGALAEGVSPDALIGGFCRGDHYCDGALAMLGEFAVLEPGAQVIYCDEDQETLGGRRQRPLLKPAWSPVFEAHAPYLGHAVFARAGAMQSQRWEMSARGFAERPADAPFIAQAAKTKVAHLRRVLLTRSEAPRIAASMPAAAKPAAAAIAPRRLRATIIIPNKDRIRLLSECLASLKKTRLDGAFEIVIVDNGSSTRAAEEFYASLAQDPRVRIIYEPGPFNFSSLCNAGAAAARADTLVFLNNDTVAHQPKWLSILLGFAARPDAGAVGAKLLYEKGHVQHAGIVLGMSVIAGHVGYKARAAEPGYLGRFQAPHEISAVTGACLAVEKSKFDAVGGFDAVNLPVELSDVDLCLRLEERGWVSILAPEAMLIHHESVSRGRSLESHKRYERECNWFKKRWARRVRDDPYFHPALSLDSSSPALG